MANLKNNQSVSGRGGRRVGAGRKAGVPNRREVMEASPETRRRINKHSPLDVMILTMNAFISSADILGKDIIKVNERIVTQLGLLERASSIAKDCAPYVHPRLANIEHTGKDGKPIEHNIALSPNDAYMQMVRGR